MAAVYNRFDYAAERRQALIVWANYLEAVIGEEKCRIWSEELRRKQLISDGSPTLRFRTGIHLRRVVAESGK